MKNRKIISFICAIAMIMSVFAGFTTVSAAGKGIGLTATMNDTATEITVVATAVGTADTGVTDATIAFKLPDGVALENTSYTSTNDAGGTVTWTPNVKDGGYYMSFFDPAGLGIKFKDNVLATITIELPAAMTAKTALTLLGDSSISDAEGGVKVGLDTMDATTTVASNPIARTEKPEGGKPKPFPAGTDPEPVVTTKKGINLSATLNDDNTVLTVVATAVGTADTGVTDATIAFKLPDGVALENTSYTSTNDAGGTVTWTPNVKDGGYYMSFFDPAGLGIKFKDNVLATITIELPAAMTAKTALTLLGDSSISDAEGGVKVGLDTMDATTAVATPTKAKVNSTEVDLKDYMGKDGDKSATDVAKDAETDTTGKYGDLWIDVQITKDNGSGGREPAKYGEDYVAKYDLDGDGEPEELTEKQYRDLISGNTETKMSDVIEGLTFEVYDTAKDVQIQTSLFAEKIDESLVDKNENTEVDQNPGSDKTAAASLTPKSAKKTATVGKAVSDTFKVTLAKNKKGESVPNKTKVTISVDENSFEVLPSTGISVSYKYNDGEEDKTETKRILISDPEIVLENEASDNQYTVSFTPMLATEKDKPVKYTVSFKDGNDNDISTTLEYTVKDKGTNDNDNDNDSSGSSSSSGGNGKGSIASGNQSGNNSGFIGTFSDMAGYDWAQTAVTALSLKHIVSGRGDGTFDPAGQITRAEYAQMLINAIGKSSDYADTTFNDVPTDSWFYHNVAVAAQLGIVSGYGDGNFGPYDLITREQMALMTQKAAVVMNKALTAKAVVTFNDDADIADWSKAAVYELANAGIINGMGDGTFAPKANATRAQAAVIIYGAFVK